MARWAATASSTCWSTFFFGSSCGSWDRNPMRVPWAGNASPAKSLSTPAMMRSRVLLPAPTRVALIQHTLVIPGREKGRPPLRIAFASDLHLGPTTPREVLDAAFAQLQSTRPDVLALGGDYVFLGATKERVRELQERVKQVSAAVKVAVLGNHDFWARPERLEDGLTHAGGPGPGNDSGRLPPPPAHVALVG